MRKNIYFLFFCFCLLVCGNISISFGEEVKNCESYGEEYDSYITENANNTNYSEIISSINNYVSIFEQNACTNKLAEARCKLVDVGFLNDNSDLKCDENAADGCDTLIKQIESIIESSDSDYNVYACSTLSKLKEYKNNYRRAACSFYTNEYEKFRNEDYAEFLKRIDPNGVESNGSTQLVCKIEGNSYSPDDCLSISNEINEYEAKFKKYNCSYKPSKLMCDKLEFDFVTNFTNSNCTTLSTNNNEQMKACYDFLNQLDSKYLLEYKNNNCITDKLETVKNRVCDFYEDGYTNYLAVINTENGPKCNENDASNCKDIINKMENEENGYLKFLKEYNCSAQDITCELIDFKFFDQTLGLLCDKIADESELENCTKLVEYIDNYLLDIKNNKCTSINNELENDRNKYNQAICEYHNDQYKIYLEANNAKCIFGNDMSGCQTIIDDINNTYLRSFELNKCTNGLSVLKCNLLEFSFNNDSLSYSCDVNNIKTEEGIVGCQNLIKQINNYLVKYNNNRCNTDNLNEYKVNYNKAICDYYITQYNNYLKNINGTGLQCNDENKVDCATIADEINKYSKLFKSNSCSVESSELQCKFIEFNLKKNLADYSCNVSLDGKISDEVEAKNCSDFVIKIDEVLSDKSDPCNIKGKLKEDRNTYLTAICDFYSNQYNNYLNDKICVENNNKDCVDIIDAIYNSSTDTGYIKLFETNKCSNELAKTKCDLIDFDFINKTNGLSCELNSNNAIENETNAKKCSDLLALINSYLLEIKDNNCNKKDELEEKINVYRKAICDFYSKKYTGFYNVKYMEYLEDLISGKLVCEKDTNGKYLKDECLIIPNEIKQDINNYISIFNKNECSATLSSKSECDLLELEFTMDSSNAYCRTISTNKEAQMAKCYNFIQQIDEIYLSRYENKNCSIDGLTTVKNSICKLYGDGYNEFFENDYKDIVKEIKIGGIICNKNSETKQYENENCLNASNKLSEYKTLFSKYNCSNEEAIKSNCEYLSFELIADSSDYYCGTFNKNTPEQENTSESEQTDTSESEQTGISKLEQMNTCYNFLNTIVGKYKSEYEKYNCKTDSYICDLYANDYDNYIKNVNSLDRNGLVCDKEDTKDCRIIVDHIDKYILIFKANKCTSKLSEANCKKSELELSEFLKNPPDYSCKTNTETGLVEINSKNDLEDCTKFVVELDDFLKDLKENNCTIDEKLETSINSYKTANCNFYNDYYKNYFEKIVTYDEIIKDPDIIKNNNVEDNNVKDSNEKLWCVKWFYNNDCRDILTSENSVKDYTCIKNDIDTECQVVVKSADETYMCVKGYNDDCQKIITETENYISFFQKNNCPQMETFELAKCKKIEFDFNNEAYSYSCPRNKDSSTIKNEEDVESCKNLINKMKEYLDQYNTLYDEEKINCSQKTQMQNYKNEYNKAICKFYETEYQKYLDNINLVVSETSVEEEGKTATDSRTLTEGNGETKTDSNDSLKCSRKDSTDCKTILNDLNAYIKSFDDNNCTKYNISPDIQCQLTKYTFIEELSNSSCKDASINDSKGLFKCRQFIEASYKKYLPEYEKNKCSNEYKCGLFLNEFEILTDNYYSLCKQGTSDSTTSVNSKNVLGNCSEAVFGLEQFYLKVRNYSCKYKAIGSDNNDKNNNDNNNTSADKSIADETLEIIKKYNKNIDDLINTGTGGIKSNGIARGLCYAINIISGPFGKAVASLFIILLGMSFLSGQSESLSFKSLISIAFALALIFGAEQLANIISRNVYSCKYIIIND